MHSDVRASEQLKTAGEIEEKAAEWLIRVDSDQKPDCRATLEAWLEANPRYRAAFVRLSAAWQRADCMRRLTDGLEEPDPDLLAPGRRRSRG